MHVECIIYSVPETIVRINNIELEKCVVIDGYRPIPSSVISQQDA